MEPAPSGAGDEDVLYDQQILLIDPQWSRRPKAPVTR